MSVSRPHSAPGEFPTSATVRRNCTRLINLLNPVIQDVEKYQEPFDFSILHSEAIPSVITSNSGALSSYIFTIESTHEKQGIVRATIQHMLDSDRYVADHEMLREYLIRRDVDNILEIVHQWTLPLLNMRLKELTAMNLADRNTMEAQLSRVASSSHSRSNRSTPLFHNPHMSSPIPAQSAQTVVSIRQTNVPPLPVSTTQFIPPSVAVSNSPFIPQSTLASNPPFPQKSAPASNSLFIPPPIHASYRSQPPTVVASHPTHSPTGRVTQPTMSGTTNGPYTVTRSDETVLLPPIFPPSTQGYPYVRNAIATHTATVATIREDYVQAPNKTTQITTAFSNPPPQSNALSNPNALNNQVFPFAQYQAFQPANNPTNPHAMYRAQGQQGAYVPRLPEIQLPIFDGNPLEWSEHIAASEMTFGAQNIPIPAKMLHPRQSLKGEAKTCISKFGANGYAIALVHLRERYGKNRIMKPKRIPRIQLSIFIRDPLQWNAFLAAFAMAGDSQPIPLLNGANSSLFKFLSKSYPFDRGRLASYPFITHSIHCLKRSQTALPFTTSYSLFPIHSILFIHPDCLLSVCHLSSLPLSHPFEKRRTHPSSHFYNRQRGMKGRRKRKERQVSSMDHDCKWNQKL